METHAQGEGHSGSTAGPTRLQRWVPDSHIIDTVAAKAGRDKYIKLLSVAQLGVSCHQLLQAPLFATQLWHTTQTLTNSHSRSSEANRYYNKQIMIAFILQVGRQWPK